VAFSSFYDPQWYTFAYYLKEADGTPAATPRASAPPAVVDHSFSAVFCSDWALPVDGYTELARHLATLKARAPQMIASPLALGAAVGCLGWPSAPVNPQRRLRPTRTPTLLVNPRHDPATAYAWAQSVAAQLGPAATLVTYDGWGHVAYGRTDCVTGLVDAYLIAARTPPAGASCPGVVPPPFGVGKRTEPGGRTPPGWGYR
jgi:hypothetical protein